MGLKRGEYVIMNDYDCPKSRLVAVLTRYDDKAGIWHALYLSTLTKMTAPLGEQPTPLRNFGKAVEWSEDSWNYRVIDKDYPCIATYRDGKQRKWQEFSPSAWLEVRQNTICAICRIAKEKPNFL